MVFTISVLQPVEMPQQVTGWQKLSWEVPHLPKQSELKL